MSFTFTPTEIPDVVLVEPQVHGDRRGFFEETYRADVFAANGIDATFVQDNHSFSRRGVLRGMHWQRPPFCQGKLVSVLVGRIWDVAVDIRAGSPTYGMWVGRELSDDNHHLLWIPPGFAHGFAVLSDEAHFLYKCTARYAHESEAGFAWDDPDVAIAWPDCGAPCISPRDTCLPRFSEIEPICLQRD